jgi:TolA-binding protein
MIAKTFMTVEKKFLKLILYSIIFSILAGCAFSKAAPPPKSSARKQVDAKAQQRHYDLGLQHYTKENYGEAKESFEQVVDLGPNTALGQKAQENLKKIQRILKTLEEIESK